MATGDGSTGFVLNGAGASDRSGTSATAIGDVNNDGIVDIVIGAVDAENPAGQSSGVVYLVYGRKGASPFPAEFELSSIAGGTGSTGSLLYNSTGGSVGRRAGDVTGDINGDGVDDIIIGGLGSTYVVYGRDADSGPLPLAFDLGSLPGGDGSDGFVLWDLGWVSGEAGDINDDGIDDLVAAGFTDTDEYPDYSAYVVFGRRAADGGIPPELYSSHSGDGSDGTFIFSRNTGDGTGWVIDTGDINGDGLDDLLLGAPWGLYVLDCPDGGCGLPGAVRVIYGRDASDPAFSGVTREDFRLTGAGENSQFGSGLAVGDIDGDGIDDMAIGQPTADPGDREDAGAVYVVYGRRGEPGVFPQEVDLDALANGDGSTGFILNGSSIDEGAGTKVALGDVNDDGRADILVGTGNALGASQRQAYVVFGRDGSTGGFPAVFELASLVEGGGEEGFVLDGLNLLNRCCYGQSDSGAWLNSGDINGDGVDDLIIGDELAGVRARDEAGKTYVVYGRASGNTGGDGIGSVGDYVWRDADGDGVQDAAESGWGGVTVSLRECNGPVLAATSTDGSGHYMFTGLVPGRYQVEVSVPAGATFSPKGAGSDPNLNSDIREDTGKSWCTSITSAGEERTTLDAGLVPSGGTSDGGSVGDYVWRDSNGDGVQDPSETGWAGLTVSLYECNGPVIAATGTDANGRYRFDALAPGRYQVEVPLPVGATYSPKAAGNDPNLNSDVREDTGKSWCTSITSAGEERSTLDAGLIPSGAGSGSSLGDFVWNDLNRNGLQDSGEPGLYHVKIKLRDCNGVYQQTTFTDKDGRYELPDLVPGMYIVDFITPDGMMRSPADAASDEGSDSDAGPDGYSYCIDLGEQDRRKGIDAGFY